MRWKNQLPAAAVLCLTALCLGTFAPAAVAEDKRSHQWYLDAMQAERMWRTSTGAGVTVAVIDSGVDGSVPELHGQLLAGKDFSGEGRGAHYDGEGHGTSVAVVIAGKRDGQNTWGLAPGSRLLPIRAQGSNGITNMAKSIRYAADQGAKVINISRVGPSGKAAKDELQPAVDYANKKGSLIFAGTGNHGTEGNAPVYPSSLPGVVGVGSVDKSLKASKFSVHGPQVALAAPGVSIPTRCTKKFLGCTADGTSYSTAIASASAALIWSAHPTWTNNQVLRVMMETAGKPEDGKVPSEYLGYGIVRPRKVLLDKEGDPGPADVNPLLAARETTAPPKTPQSGADNSAAGSAQKPADHPDDSPPWPLTAGLAATVSALAAGGLVIVRRRKA
ncbi:type VII secretion-associated serine protease mycosin [Streptomyces hygroscopicus]|uniref:type VII secretion-associated serine protease mycosin n=1 Tax=Streptomyces hygroscopicus TaxID=1912 RepID=UPI001FCC9E53|nr:type VII secretion-associated serine protease mycosin [Streptomyces hygroscopicus]BDH09236.1 type VII secretion-associated serine protease [Streptomyces hygroscopicus]